MPDFQKISDFKTYGLTVSEKKRTFRVNRANVDIQPSYSFKMPSNTESLKADPFFLMALMPYIESDPNLGILVDENSHILFKRLTATTAVVEFFEDAVL